jgi:hypothetical protein
LKNRNFKSSLQLPKRNQEDKGMVVYSEMIPQDAILQGVGDAKKVTIIACSHCANTSIAYVKNISLGKSRGGAMLSMLTSKPTALIQEANSIKELLEGKGKTVKIEILGKMMPPCGMNEKGHRKIAKIAQGSDCVVALSCISGSLGMKSALPKSCRVFPAMNTVGWLETFRKVESGNMIIDKQKSRVIYAKGCQTPK